MGSTLASQFPDEQQHFRKYLKPVECSFILKPADTKSVEDLLMQLSTDKSPGLDYIPANLIKIAALIISSSLCELFIIDDWCFS